VPYVRCPSCAVKTYTTGTPYGRDRCPGCDAVMLRVMRGPTQVRLDATGIRLLVILDASPIS